MKRVVGDLEANGLLDTADTIWCGVFIDIHTGEETVFDPDTIHTLPAWLDTVDVLIMHNGIGYDLPLMRKVLGYEYKGRVIDTLVLSRLQRPERVSPKGCRAGPHSVESYGVNFGVPKPEHEDWSRYSEDMLHRCRQDTVIQRMILTSLMEDAKKYNWKAASQLSMELFEILHKQEEYGWLFDDELALDSYYQLTKWMRWISTAVQDKLPYLCIRAKKVKGEYAYYKAPFKVNGELKSFVQTFLDGNWPDLCVRSIGGPFSQVNFRRADVSKGQEVKDFLLSEGWVPREWNTNDNGERTSPKLKHDEPFEGVEGKLGRLIARWVQCRHRRSQIEGWLKIQRSDNRVPQRITGIASTGRLKHAGIVNVPGAEVFYGKRMRKLFTSRDGYVIVGVDSAGCQNRMLAGRVGDPSYTKTLLEGTKEDRTSIHYVNQAAITRLAGFTPSYKVCKNLNYAFLFGASDNKLASTAAVDRGTGEDIRRALFSVAPGLERLVNELTAEWKSTARRVRGRYGMEYRDGTITGLDGRPIRIESEHCILVYMLQSDEAILMQYALVFLYRWLTERGWVYGEDYGFVANVHDEIQAEVLAGKAEEYAALACKAIEYAGEYLNIQCEHKGEYDIGNNWYETH